MLTDFKRAEGKCLDFVPTGFRKAAGNCLVYAQALALGWEQENAMKVSLANPSLHTLQLLTLSSISKVAGQCSKELPLPVPARQNKGIMPKYTYVG